MPTMDEYYDLLDGLRDSPSPDLPKQFNTMSIDEKDAFIEPLVEYHNAMNNVMMSGPAREGRATMQVGSTEQNVYPYSTMYPTFPQKPGVGFDGYRNTNYELQYFPQQGELESINNYLRNFTGISQQQSQARMDAGQDPNMIPGFSLTPTPSEFITIRDAAGQSAFPVPPLAPQQPQQPKGLLEEAEEIYKGLFR